MKLNWITGLMAAAMLLSVPADVFALRLEPIKYGNFSSWVTRKIKESKVIGGKEKVLYEIGPQQTITGNKKYSNLGGSPWGTSNVYAKVSGVEKGSCAVTPFNLNGNTVCKMSTIMEHVKVLGLINMDVMVAGSIFLGNVFEPITSTKNPYAKMEMGIPYTKRPVALVFDYKVDMPNVNTRVKSSGIGSKKTLQGRDNAEVYILLQKRWEDAKGNIYAARVGTGRERYSKSIPWTKGHQLKIQYGDITKKPGYKSYMGLLDGNKAYYARNSKGKVVPVHEVEWAAADETPTHMLVMASSGCGEAYVGTEGVSLYIDNISLGF
ncbi:MAG: PCMD domain-containing protein [Prevotella sp.]|nr:PCMD domain-containing protein [Bacteroides sp.]MCM1366555.1 PCMD domain-containing protein [Prevotella sp.]MCM1436865.1 PCMD domain-containing protein [Prevotella sp.]